ncbi:hypothetical protein Bca52824_086432 [Brassica carinata]|uniref:Uncharacterized protein n=1 Tax=Brassica carinata TaxID=52824 RepID=A0A8X7PBS2_BRACI|nr:hypothetical protein Bca52824_086432 [Brassica carinata]
MRRVYTNKKTARLMTVLRFQRRRGVWSVWVVATRSVPPSYAPPPLLIEVFTVQLKDKDDRISLLETEMTAQQAGYEAQRRLNQQMMEMMRECTQASTGIAKGMRTKVENCRLKFIDHGSEKDMVMGLDYSYTQPSDSEDYGLRNSADSGNSSTEMNIMLDQAEIEAVQNQYTLQPEVEFGFPKECYCGREPLLATSYTRNDPGRRFYTCGQESTAMPAACAVEMIQRRLSSKAIYLEAVPSLGHGYLGICHGSIGL